jgi:hypothetical protein
LNATRPVTRNRSKAARLVCSPDEPIFGGTYTGPGSYDLRGIGSSHQMATEIKKEIKLEIGHVLFMDIVVF